jgi:hypothetical protein
VGTAFTIPLGATVEDIYGNPVAVNGTTVTFTGPAGGAGGTFANGTDTTSSATNGGVATASTFSAGGTAGSFTVTVSSGGLTSSSFSETDIALSVPGVPTGLSATLGNTTVGLSWTGPSSNGGSVISGYNVYEGTSAGGESSTPVGGAFLSGCASLSGSMLCTVSGLSNGTTYFFTVRAVNVVGPSAASNGASATPTTPWSGGYDLAAADGGVFSLGGSGFYGSIGGKPLTRPIVGMAVNPEGGGYWLVASDGGVFAFGNAGYYGSEGGKPLDKPIVGMAVTTNGKGYWLVASDGGIFSFGNAAFAGSEGGKPLDKPIVGMAADPVTGGYWLVASDGGIFSFDAAFGGSLGGTRLSKPIVAMATS